MDNFSDGLKNIFTLDTRYAFLLLFFILMFSSLIYYDLPIYVQIFFFFGLVLIPISYQKKTKEIAELKMKVLYVKTKLSDRISDFENLLLENDKIVGREAIEKVLENMKLEETQNKAS